MAVFELKMPKLGESVTEGTIGKWLKQPGEKVNKYDLLVEVQTDKVNTEIPSPVAGTLKEVKVDEGQTVPIGTLLATFDTDGDAAAASPAAATPQAAAPQGAPPASPQRQAPPSPQPAASASASSTATAERPDLSEVRATPAVRKLASENGIDISQIEGTGLGGRVSKKDVEDYIASAQAAPPPPAQQPQAVRPTAASQVVSGGPAPLAARPAPPTSLAGDELVPLSPMRRAIATNMVQAWSAPHAHAVMEIDMTALMKYREKVRGDFQAREGFDLSPAAFICKAAVEALRTVPLVNSSFTDQGVIAHREINLGYAVALGDEGLVVPVIRDADGKSLAGLMRAIRDVVDRAKARRLTFDDFYGGTFTVNNTGPLGTIISSPIVPPGQAAIISSETIVKRLIVTDDDAIAIRQRMNLVIGFDHRVIDGATAARFLQTMRDWLQTVGPTVPVY
ncbi:MAG TPA: dihydrolipoamide acetyltransferase family protein [Candidatus Limnocylindria bacterium]|nr:dihydrolipoamide acetyltransferase family protein [Candidatus Limnocylindria bacterium]